LAVHIRLRRTGKTKAPTYRVVVADSRSPRDGKFIEILGHYNPRTEEGALVLDTDRVRHWIKNGAKPTSTARALLVRSGIPDAEVPPVARRARNPSSSSTSRRHSWTIPPASW
jgi:small subunit ribosomal protein S16